MQSHSRDKQTVHNAEMREDARVHSATAAHEVSYDGHLADSSPVHKVTSRAQSARPAPVRPVSQDILGSGQDTTEIRTRTSDALPLRRYSRAVLEVRSTEYQ